MPDAGSYRGAEARRWLKAWVDSFDGLTQEAVEFIDGGDQVAIEFIQRGRSRGSDSAVELRSWAVMTIRDGSLARTELFLSKSEALKAAGLEE